MKQARNMLLDLLKFIAALFVVFIHVPFPSVFGEAVKLLGRFAVPLFFMTSGYYSVGNDAPTLLRKTKKIGFILLFASLLYNATNVLELLVSEGADAALSYFSRFLSLSGWLKLLLFSLPFSATRLWFLFSLIYVYLLHLLLNRGAFSKKARILFALGGMVCRLALVLVLDAMGVRAPDFVFRFVLLYGYPFFLLGHLLKEYEARVVSLDHFALFAAAFCGGALSLLPLVVPSRAHYGLGTLLLLFSLFTLAQKNKDALFPPCCAHLFSCSLGIYVFHRPVTTVLSFCLSRTLGKTLLFEVLLPPAVCLATILFVLVLKRVAKRPKKALKQAKTKNG